MSNLIRIYSDTQTQPSPQMRAAMASAEVGDEQGGSDPTVNELCRRVAEYLGKESAVFLPSGTMCNEIAMMIHCRPGDEIIAHETAHIINSEAGGPAAFAGAMIKPLRGERGQFSGEDVLAAVRPDSRYVPVSRLLVVEQTSNFGGGTVWSLERIKEVASAARSAGLAVHMDGARLSNAAVASGTSAADFSAPFDSVWLDLTKGLGCPVGAVLAGSEDFIQAAWRIKQRMGGAMRQAGIIAAAGLYALDNNIDRLAEDHANAKKFAATIAKHPLVRLDPDAVETNIIFFEIDAPGKTLEDLCAEFLKRGMQRGAIVGHAIRIVTHLDVSAKQMEVAAETVVEILDGWN